MEAIKKIGLNKIAKIINTNIVSNLTLLDILFGDVFAHHFNKK